MAAYRPEPTTTALATREAPLLGARSRLLHPTTVEARHPAPPQLQRTGLTPQRLAWSKQLITMGLELFARADRIEEHVRTAEYAGVANAAWTKDKIGEVESLEREVTKLAKGLQDFGALQTWQLRIRQGKQRHGGRATGNCRRASR